MRRSTRWTIAGAAVVAALGATGSGLARASSPSPAPTSTVTSKDSPPAGSVVAGKQPPQSKPDGRQGLDPRLVALAGRLGVSQQQFEQALGDLKLFVATHGGKPTDPAAVAAFARSLGISVDQARAAIQEIASVPGRDKKGGPASKDEDDAAAVAAIARQLATRLGVSQSAAAAAVRQLNAMGRNGGIDPGSAQFAATARQLGVTPARLIQALDAIKRGMPQGKDDQGKKSPAPNPSPSSKPTG